MSKPNEPIAHSFLDREKALLFALPADLDSSTKLVLLGLFVFAGLDGGGIYVSIGHLADMLGMPRRTVCWHLAVLTKRGFVMDDGWKTHGNRGRTRMRRIDFAAIEGARSQHVASATHCTLSGRCEAEQSATHGTRQSATHGTQTESLNRKIKNHVILTWRPEGRSVAQIKKILWTEGVGLIEGLTGLRERQARGLLATLIKQTGRHPDNVITALQSASDIKPADAAAYLMKACMKQSPRRQRFGSIFDLENPAPIVEPKQQEADKAPEPTREPIIMGQEPTPGELEAAEAKLIGMGFSYGEAAAFCDETRYGKFDLSRVAQAEKMGAWDYLDAPTRRYRKMEWIKAAPGSLIDQSWQHEQSAGTG